MEGKVAVSSKATIDDLGDVVPVGLIRELPPAHCNSQSRSIFSSSRLRLSLQSTYYKWILQIYPRGNYAEGGNGYISIYVSMVGKLKPGTFVNVALHLFYLRPNKGQLPDYSVCPKEAIFIHEDVLGDIPIPTSRVFQIFNNASSGFLIDNICIFGAEVLVLDHTHIQTPLLSMTKCDERYTWRIEKFSDLGAGLTYSSMFTFGDWSWKIGLYPKGHDEEAGETLTACLELQNGDDLTKGSKLMVK
ncbi:hypothetical protein vseg_000988 [Gypsophila vaccaria]